MSSAIAEPITEVQERSMASLAKILRENGVRVVQVIEEWQGASNIPRITFDVHKDQEALAVADIAVKSDYPLWMLAHKWVYMDSEPEELFWVIEFRPSGSPPLLSR